MFDLIPIYIPLGIGLVVMVIGYSTSYIFMRKGSYDGYVVAGFIRIIFMGAVPGLSIVAILSYYFPIWTGLYFFLWIIYVCVITIFFILKARKRKDKM
jgi:hypothetical protein